MLRFWGAYTRRFASSKVICDMTDSINWVALALFALAILHTFCTGIFERLAHRSPRHAGLWHLLGEVEVVFGLWAMVLFVALVVLQGAGDAVAYVDGRNYTEPLFVFAIMTVAATRPILQLVDGLVDRLSRVLPGAGAAGRWWLILLLIPLLGSLITEPAAMTVAAMALSREFASATLTPRLKYAALGVLFVNVSIGGTLTHFAAPPVLMVAAAWDWDSAFMLTTFGWKSALAVCVNASALVWIFRTELASLPTQRPEPQTGALPVPWTLMGVYVALLAGIVLAAHHPAVFMALLLLCLGICHAYPQYQERLVLKEALLVAFFLAGLVVLGGMQAWWLQPVLEQMPSWAMFWGAMGLTAVTDNAAITYLGAQVPGLSDSLKYALMAGAVAGGGLTVIANAPNPAGLAILRGHFDGGVVSAGRLFLAALGPTAVAAAALLLL